MIREGFLQRKNELDEGGRKAATRSWKNYYYSVLIGPLLNFYKDKRDFQQVAIISYSAKHKIGNFDVILWGCKFITQKYYCIVSDSIPYTCSYVVCIQKIYCTCIVSDSSCTHGTHTLTANVRSYKILHTHTCALACSTFQPALPSM